MDKRDYQNKDNEHYIPENHTLFKHDGASDKNEEIIKLSSEYLQSKKINFTQIDDVDHTAENMTTFYSDKTMTISLAKEGNETFIYISSTYFGTVKQSLFLMDFKSGRFEKIHGKSNIKYIESFSPTGILKLVNIFKNNICLNLSHSFTIKHGYKRPKTELRSKPKRNGIKEFSLTVNDKESLLSTKLQHGLTKYFNTIGYTIGIRSVKETENTRKLCLKSSINKSILTITGTAVQKEIAVIGLYIELMKGYNIRLEETKTEKHEQNVDQ